VDNDFTISEYDWSEIWSDPDRKFGPEEVEDTFTSIVSLAGLAMRRWTWSLL
jgi:hypothetical protein